MDHITIKNWSEEDRPREKLISKGRSVLSDAELLAILLGSGSRKETAVELANKILKSVDWNLASLSKLSVNDFKKKFHGVGVAKAVTIVSALELGYRRAQSKTEVRESIRSSKDAFLQVFSHLTELPYEEFWVLFLNQRNVVIHKECIGSGGLSQVTTDIRKIMRLALEHKTSAMILAHNHPSGSIEPSEADKQMTQKLKQASTLFDIRLLDHIIVGFDQDYFSFADASLL